MDKVNLKIEEIAAILTMQDPAELTQYGLYTGTAGIACFLHEYAHYTKNEDAHLAAMRMVNRTIDLIFETKPYASHCDGLAGVANFLNDLESERRIKNSISNDIDRFLEIELQNEINRNYYDFLHGATGIAYYFVNRSGNRYFNKHKQTIRNTLLYFDQTAIKYEENGIKYAKWLSYDRINKESIINISLSHGMSSIIGLLLRMYQVSFTIDRERITELIERGINYILSQQIDRNNYGSCFPRSSIESMKEMTGSRLAWCYGDLGVASILWQAGGIFKNETWKNIAIDTFLFCTERKDHHKDQVVDACFCHGTSGIAHIFNRIYRETGIQKFKDTSNYWIMETLQMARYEDGAAGYKVHSGDETNTWNSDIYMLDGIAGIGLTLIASISDKNPQWDKYFLLS